MTLSLFSLSRLPVGSSAMSILEGLASALAMARRCFCPLDSFAARLRGWGLAASLGDLGFSFGEEDAEACMDYLCGMDEMKAAGANAVPKLREALRVVFA